MNEPTNEPELLTLNEIATLFNTVYPEVSPFSPSNIPPPYKEVAQAQRAKCKAYYEPKIVQGYERGYNACREIMGCEIAEAVKAERERIPDTIQPYLHWHRGEWCFTPKKYVEMKQVLQEDNK